MDTIRENHREAAGFDRLAVVDLETTGLEPDTGLILEIGVVVVDPELNEVACRCVLLTEPRGVEWAERVRRAAGGTDLDVPARMHLSNGLVDDLLDPHRFLAGEDGPTNHVVACTTAAAEKVVCTFLDDQGITEPVPLAGSSGRSLDGPFLKRHMPLLYSRFTHRTVDASALSEFARFIDPDGHAAIMANVPASGHRTVGDCRRSIEIMRRFAAHYGIRSGVAGS